MTKRDYYEVLGLTKAATDDDIKKAYRRLSSAHHPDKHTSATPEERAKHEALFKEAKEAYEVLSDARRREAYDAGGDGSGNGFFNRGNLNDLMDQLRRARGFGGFNGIFKQVTQLQAAVSLKEAFEGFSIQLQHPDGSTQEVKVGPGTPDGYRQQVEVSPNLAAIITTRIQDSTFRVTPAAESGWHSELVNGQPVVVIETGDIETTIKVDALDVLLGTWATVPSIEGERLQVRVPAGLNPTQRLKVKGKGYYHWLHDLNRPGSRGDLYVKVEPIFSPLKSIPLSKAEALVDAIKALQPPP